MRKIFIVILLLCCGFITFAQDISIIPEPVSLVKNSGQFVIPANVIIETGNDAAVKKVAESFSRQLSVPTGYKVSLIPQAGAALSG